MQGSEPNTPDEGAPTKEGERADVTEPAAIERDEVETPQAASMARSSPASSKEAPVRGWRSFFRLGARTRWLLAAAGGAAVLLGAFVGAPFVRAWRNEGAANGAPVRAAAIAATVAASEAAVDAGLDAGAPLAQPDPVPSKPPIWRVALLAQDGAIRLVEQTVGRRPLLSVLAAAGLRSHEAMRVTDSLAVVHSIDRVSPKDSLTLALDKASGRVVAYELASSPDEVWQGREVAQDDGGLKIEAQRLDLQTSRVRVGRAVLVGADLRTSLADAGLTPVDDVVSMLDDALEGHAEISDIRPGARIRLVGTQEQVEGSFVRWVSFDAVEYFPATPSAAPVRVYAFGDGDGPGDAKKRHGWYDAKGRQPFHGGYRSPVPLARIASRYNPHRMHPVLHVIMPHNGVDFAAPVGAPVYATAAGVVMSVGNEGPCGNKVEISHPGGVTSVYCHLSRYAAGLRVGQHVEQRQLIAYVGQTGRVTGPHLHFGIKKNGVFVDPMSLRLDGVRVVPRAVRDDFDRRRAELDSELDGIALPPVAPGAAGTDTVEPETIYEEP